MSQNEPGKQNTSHVKSVVRALMLVEAMAREQREMTLTELAQLLGWPKSTVHGMLSTMRDFQYIEQSHINGRYRLGVRFFEIGTMVARSWDIRVIAKPYLHQLSNALGETVQLGVENQGQVLYLEKIESNHVIRIVSDIGSRLPMHCSALGKMLLAHKTSSEVLRISATHGMAQMTARTITNVDQLQQELLKIRRQGYSLDDREIMDALRCVAAPIYNSDGRVLYAISASGLYEQFQGERLDNIIRQTCATAQNISASMGYTGRRQDADEMS